MRDLELFILILTNLITPEKFTHKFYYYVLILIELYFSNFKFTRVHHGVLNMHKVRYARTTDYSITIKVSHRQHVSTNQVVIIRAIT